MLLRISPKQREISLAILRWTTLAARPLQLQEPAAAVGLLTPSSPVTVGQAIRDAIALCGPLLRIQEQEVSLVHQSTRDYLLPRNILWNEETKHVMVIDSERAEVEQRTVLGVISANCKRKKPRGSSVKQGQTKPSACTQEIRRAMFELNGMAQSIRCR